MHIGNLKIEIPLFLAPMAGITDHPFRVLCREMGAGVVYSEFVSANGIVRENVKTLELMNFTEDERPIGIQIFGEDPDIVSRSARMVYNLLKPDIIDINYGCPVPKVTKRGAGSAALKNLSLMDEITQAEVEAVPEIPVTVCPVLTERVRWCALGYCRCKDNDPENRGLTMIGARNSGLHF